MIFDTDMEQSRSEEDLPPIIAPSQPSDMSDSRDKDEILKNAYRKVDVRLLTWYTFVVLLMAIEGHNIANAAILNKGEGTNIKHQLGNLSSEQWAHVLSIYHYPHIFFEPIATLLVKKLTPRKWMSGSMVLWGVLSTCQGAANSFGSLMACRVIIGFAVAGFGPSLLFHLSFWYPTERLPMRFACIFAISGLAGAFGGLLAYGISFLSGKAGLAGWQYLFILEGVPSVICGIFSFFLLPNYPEDVTFLSEREKSAIIDNLPTTQPHSGDKTWSWTQAKAFCKEVTTYTFLLIWLCHGIGGKGVNTVLPTVMDHLGLTGSTTTQLLTITPYVIGSLGLLCIAYLVQRKKINAWIPALCLESVICAFYIVLVVIEQPVAKYVVVVFATGLSHMVFPLLWPERIRASEGTTTAGLAIGITTAAGELHGIISPHIYQNAFKPSYRISFETSIGVVGLAIVAMAVTRAIIWRRDKRSAKLQERKDEVEMAPVGGHERNDSGLIFQDEERERQELDMTSQADGPGCKCSAIATQIEV